MPKTRLIAIATALATLSFAAGAGAAAPAPQLGLSQYRLGAEHALDTLGGAGLEASAVTYARDRGTLFFVGDEGLGVVEITRAGRTLGSMAFDWTGTGSTHDDAEGLAYLGAGVLVVAEERLQDLYRFGYAAGGRVALASAPSVSLGPTVGNIGTEGISFDARDGSFVSVKQDDPVELRLSTAVAFAPGGGSATTTTLFSGSSSLFGLGNLADVQTLSGVDRLAGTAAADHLLLLSQASRELIEVDRAGHVFGRLDLSGLTTQAIEGVTVDEAGVIYLVAEDSGAGASRLFVMTPVPEPASAALMLAGLAAAGAVARRRRASPPPPDTPPGAAR